MDDLFSTARSNIDHLELAGADVVFARGFLTREDAEHLFSELRNVTPWKAVEISVWGKRVMQPRLISWHGDTDASYKYSGVRLQPEPWTPTLLRLREQIEQFTKTNFNSVLLNLYRDQNDSMGWHSDDEPELGERPTIASLSLGETRHFLMRNKSAATSPKVSLPLSSGSLLVMSGDTQRNWKHAIRREVGQMGPRINLTFRRIVRREAH